MEDNAPIEPKTNESEMEKMDGKPIGENNSDPGKRRESEEDTGAKTKDKDADDPYAYANNGDTFTSESFKIEIMRIPKFCGFKELRKYLNTIDVDPVKIKIPYRATYAFATFRSEDDRQAALSTIEGKIWKGLELKVKKAAPSADPLLKRKRMLEATGDSEESAKKAKVEENPLPLEERLKDAVTPEWRSPYDKQLVVKEKAIRNFLSSLPSDIIRNNRDMKAWINDQKWQHSGLMCELVKIKASPQTENYRNKCEFTVGMSVDSKPKTVGFRLGSYKEGTVHVTSPDPCTIVPDQMKTVVKSVQKYLQEVSQHEGFDPQNKDGCWRMVTVRCNAEGHIMLVMHFNPMELSQEKINEEKEQIKTFFESGEGKDCGVTSLYFQIKNEHRVRGSEDNVEGEYELLSGKPHIYENLLGLSFRISPSAFFQVNTAAAEVLYSTVREWAELGPNTTVLDVCCGTGTIGITMAKHVKKVIGIEMCKEAVEDAKINAEINGVSERTVFRCGKAEDVLPGLMKTLLDEEDVVAIVDPPRGGLHRDVLKALRKSEVVKRLVYVSCKATSVRNNIIDLMRAPSKQIRGDPFKLTSAVPVDLFPHTSHCELVMLYERGQRVKQGEKEGGAGAEDGEGAEGVKDVGDGAKQGEKEGGVEGVKGGQEEEKEGGAEGVKDGGAWTEGVKGGHGEKEGGVEGVEGEKDGGAGAKQGEKEGGVERVKGGQEEEKEGGAEGVKDGQGEKEGGVEGVEGEKDGGAGAKQGEKEGGVERVKGGQEEEKEGGAEGVKDGQGEKEGGAGVEGAKDGQGEKEGGADGVEGEKDGGEGSKGQKEEAVVEEKMEVDGKSAEKDGQKEGETGAQEKEKDAQKDVKSVEKEMEMDGQKAEDQATKE